MPRPSRTCCYDFSVIVAMLSAGLNIGLSMGLLGPTLPDLALQTGVSLTRASTLATWRAATYIVGSLFAGVLLEYVDGFLGLATVLLLQGVTTAMAGWFSSFTLIALFQATSNFFATIMVAGVPFLVFRLERSRARMVAQAAFLLFNVGKTLVPLIVAPFLVADNSMNNTITPVTTSRPVLNNNIVPASWFPKHPSMTDPGTQVGWAYVIVGGFCLLMFFLYAGIALANGCPLWAKKTSEFAPANHVVEVIVQTDGSIVTADEPTRQDSYGDDNTSLLVKTSDKDSSPSAPQSAPTPSTSTLGVGRPLMYRTCLVIFIFMLAIFMQTGMEVVDNTLLLSFAIEYMGTTKTIGLILTSVYQGVKVVVCIGIMFIVNRVHPSSILFTDIICMMLACVGMTITVVLNQEVIFFFAISVLAIGMSNYYATILSWLEGYYPISGKLSSLISVFFGVSGMVLPPLTTAMLAKYGAVAFPFILMISSVLCCIFWGVLKVILRERICLQLNLHSEKPPTEPDERTSLVAK